MERSASAESFGDTETGWKNRLTIPPPPPRATESEGQIPQVASSVVRELWRDQQSKPVDPKQEFERPVPAGLPPDITPEEIAAITAAAASFGSQPQELQHALRLRKAKRKNPSLRLVRPPSMRAQPRQRRPLLHLLRKAKRRSPKLSLHQRKLFLPRKQQRRRKQPRETNQRRRKIPLQPILR